MHAPKVVEFKEESISKVDWATCLLNCQETAKVQDFQDAPVVVFDTLSATIRHQFLTSVHLLLMDARSSLCFITLIIGILSLNCYFIILFHCCTE